MYGVLDRPFVSAYDVNLVLISRALGPEFGGAIGVIFAVANVVSGAQAQFGFGEAVVSTYLPDTSISQYWLQFILNSAVLFVMMLVAMAGAEWFSKAAVVLFIGMMGSIAFIFFTFICAPPQLQLGFTGPSVDTLATNLLPQFVPQGGTPSTFVSVFGVLFPAVTGIMTGANLCT